MNDFFSIKTPYSSEEYKILVKMVNQGIDSNLEGFTKSKFGKCKEFNNKFQFDFAISELPILYKRMEAEYNATGNDDVHSFMEDIKSSAAEQTQPAEAELDEMVDPFDPMNAIKDPFSSDIENTIDGENNTFIPPSDEIEESDNLTLTNQHSVNAKPVTLDESYGDRYEQIVFLQGDAANEAMDILQNEGEEAAMDYLKQWHYPGEHDGEAELGAGTMDKTFEKDGYIMNWNRHLPYIGLVYDTEYGKGKLDGQIAEDSQAQRHQGSQRAKIGEVPLGQHGPHSPKAK